MVLIQKKERRKVLETLMKEGVLVLKKDWTQDSHPSFPNIAPLKIWMIMRTLKSKDLVNETFNWNHYYFFLKKEGLDFIKKELLIEANVEPLTYQNNTSKNYIINDIKKPKGEKRNPRPAGRGRRNDSATEPKPAEGTTPAVSAPEASQ